MELLKKIRVVLSKRISVGYLFKRFLFKSFFNEKYFLDKLKYEAKKVEGGVRIFGNVQANNKTYIGKNTSINTLNVIGVGECIIGEHCHFGYGLTVITSNHNYKGNAIPYDDTVIEKAVNIGDFVWIGANVTILPGVTIGDGAIIQAGSVVRNDIKSMSIAGGNPATEFASRDIEHYTRMKKERRYF